MEQGTTKNKRSFATIIKAYIPILEWGPQYTSKIFVNDLVVALIVTFMLIPQSLAYAQLAGLPAEIGLYASMIPLVLYAIFGTSKALSVGPVALTGLLTLSAVAPLAAQGTPEYLMAAAVMALLSGVILLIMGFLKLGFLSNFLSFPVISAISTACGIQIASSQLTPITGIPSEGGAFIPQFISLVKNAGQVNMYTVAIGIPTVVFLLWARKGLSPLLTKLGMGKRLAGIFSKLGPVVALVITILVANSFGLDQKGVKILGEVPSGLPELMLPAFDASLWGQLLVLALMISIIGYVASISVGQTLAAKKRQKINPDQELIALGAANLGSAISGGFPVTGGFSRSVVNFDAGAETQAAGIMTALGIALTTLFLTPLLYFLPNATLGATIFAAILSLVDFKAVKKVFAYSKVDGIAMIATILLTMLVGVIIGLIAGIGISLFAYLYRTSKPHFAILGQIPGTEHFRNVEHYETVTDPSIVSLRMDESIYFPNARFLESKVGELVATHPEMKHLVLNCSAVNNIDASGLISLLSIQKTLTESGIMLHLTEVKGPVMDGLKPTPLAKVLGDSIHLSHYDAVLSINPTLAEKTRKQR